MRHWKGDMHFQSPDEYRPLSMSSLSTHDMPSFPLWWTIEATSEEKKYLVLWADAKQPVSKKDFPAFLEHVLEKVLATKSVFSIQVIQDWLALSGESEFFKSDHRMNAPGTVSDKNWSIRLPFSLEQMLLLPINAKINQLIKSSGRKG